MKSRNGGYIRFCSINFQHRAKMILEVRVFLINRLYKSGNHWVSNELKHFVFSFSSLLASRPAANFS